MKMLSIIRHGKAELAEQAQNDFDRKLTKRGIKDTRRVTTAFHKSKIPIDWILSSSSARTRATAELLAELTAFDGTIQWEDRGYLAEAETWIALLATIPSEVQHVALVGHNPGVSNLVSALTTGATARLNIHFPTAAIANLEMEIFWWNQIRLGCGQLRWLITPKVFQ